MAIHRHRPNQQRMRPCSVSSTTRPSGSAFIPDAFPATLSPSLLSLTATALTPLLIRMALKWHHHPFISLCFFSPAEIRKLLLGVSARDMLIGAVGLRPVAYLRDDFNQTQTRDRCQFKVASHCSNDRLGYRCGGVCEI